MATDTLPAAFVSADDTPAAPLAPARKASLLRRLFDAIVEAQTRRAQREIARVLGPRGLAALHTKLPR